MIEENEFNLDTPMPGDLVDPKKVNVTGFEWPQPGRYDGCIIGDEPQIGQSVRDGVQGIWAKFPIADSNRTLVRTTFIDTFPPRFGDTPSAVQFLVACGKYPQLVNGTNPSLKQIKEAIEAAYRDQSVFMINLSWKGSSPERYKRAICEAAGKEYSEENFQEVKDLVDKGSEPQKEANRFASRGFWGFKDKYPKDKYGNYETTTYFDEETEEFVLDPSPEQKKTLTEVNVCDVVVNRYLKSKLAKEED